MRLYLFLCNCFCLSITLESNVDAVPPTKATMKTPNERRLQPPSARPFPQPLPFPRPMLSTSPLSEGGGGQSKRRRREDLEIVNSKLKEEIRSYYMYCILIRNFSIKRFSCQAAQRTGTKSYLLKKSNHFPGSCPSEGVPGRAYVSPWKQVGMG